MLLVSYGGTLVERAEARGLRSSWGRYGKSTYSADIPSVISSGPLVIEPGTNWVGSTKTLLDYRKGPRLTFVPRTGEDEEEFLLLLCVARYLGVG